MKKIILAAGLFCSTLYTAQAQKAGWRKEITGTAASVKARVGVSVLSDRDTLTIRGNERFPMQSVFKFHLGLLVMHLVDEGKLSLQQQVHFTPEDMALKSWSPIAKKYPGGNVDLSLEEVLKSTVSTSDNIGCDKLFELVGGPAALNKYLHGLGATDLSIVATEKEMHADWDVQYRNWTTPREATRLLKAFDEGKILKPASRDVMMRFMTTNTNINDRLSGLLPAGTKVAHKTGTSDTNKAGLTAATNDIGIVALPDGRHYYIAVFVSDSWEQGAKNNGVIAEISRKAWDHLVARQREGL